MARILPETLPPSLPEHLARIYSQLKGIDSEEVLCRISYRLGDAAHPDFLVVYRDRCAFLLAVSSASDEALERSFQTNLLNAYESHLVDLKESHSLGAFTRAVLEGIGSPDLPIQQWILFPKARDSTVSRFAESWKGPPRQFLGRKQCRSKELLRRFESATNADLDQECLQFIIGHFAPEAAIPSDWVVREEARTRGKRVHQYQFFLDYDQEAAMKRDLDLSHEAVEAASRGGTRLITGTAGCGKTLILLFRARLSASLFDNQRVLVLMHNKPLRADLEARARELQFHGRIEWKTFFAWIRSQMDFDLIRPQDAEAFLKEELRRKGWEKEFQVSFLREEFEWISDNALVSPSLDWYRMTIRSGRKRGLQASQREKVYVLYRSYRSYLDEKGVHDWSTIPRLFLKRLRDGLLQLTPYDTIYIDEAQFFAPVWFECVRRALHPQHGRLFMVADPTQGFLRSGQSWVQVLGSEVRGRTQRLNQPYRNTRELLDFATSFYRSRVSSEEQEVNLPSAEILGRMPAGPEPHLLKVLDGAEELAVLTDQLRGMREKNPTALNVLVIDGASRKPEMLVSLLQPEFGSLVCAADQARHRNAIRITTINACTGIEAPAVILIGIEKLLEREDALHLDSIDREQLVLHNTKKLFVAMTRAAQQLVITYSKDRTRNSLQAGK